MKLTREMARSFVGGQIEVRNPNEDYLYRGELATATVEGIGHRAIFKVTLRWNAKGEGRPLPSRWVSDDELTYVAKLDIYHVSGIGGGRLCLQSLIVGEIVVLFPPNGSKLDPSEVEGLHLS